MSSIRIAGRFDLKQLGKGPVTRSVVNKNQSQRTDYLNRNSRAAVQANRLPSNASPTAALPISFARLANE